MKNIIITGCSGGIGEGICKKYFLKNKYFVIGIDITKPKHNFINDFYNVDLNNLDEINDFIKKIGEKKVHALINNCAYQHCNNFYNNDDEIITKTLNINLKAPYFLSKKLHKNLENGYIINISSIHSICTSDKILEYAVSKNALVGLTRNMAIELSKFNIKVISISPGAIKTEMLLDGLRRNNEDLEISLKKLEDKHLLKKIGQPEDIANFCYFLTKSSFITGSNFIIDGGASTKLSTE